MPTSGRFPRADLNAFGENRYLPRSWHHPYPQIIPQFGTIDGAGLQSALPDLPLDMGSSRGFGSTPSPKRLFRIASLRLRAFHPNSATRRTRRSFLWHASPLLSLNACRRRFQGLFIPSGVLSLSLTVWFTIGRHDIRLGGWSPSSHGISGPRYQVPTTLLHVSSTAHPSGDLPRSFDYTQAARTMGSSPGPTTPHPQRSPA